MMIYLLQIIIIVITLYAITQFKSKAILFSPVFLVVFDVIYGFYQSGSGFGTIRNVLMLVFILYLVITKKDILTHNSWLLIFLIYTLLLVPLSSNLKNSITEYISVLVSMMFLPLGFAFIRNIDDLKKLNLSMIWLAAIFVANSIVSSIFNLGIDFYGSNVTLGGFVASKLFSPAIFIVILPIILPLLGSKARLMTIVLAILVFIILLISMRRTSIFIPVFGYLMYFFLSRRKVQFIGLFIIAVLMVVILFPFYQKVLMQQYTARIESFENPTLEEEYRYRETFIVIKETFSTTKTMLIGKEIYNSKGNYNQGRWFNRRIHIDYNLILHGSGIIGLILYVLIFVDLYLKYLRFRIALPQENYYQELSILFTILFFLVMIVSLNGGMVQVSYRAVIMLYLGGILGILNKYYEYKQRFSV